MNRSGYTMRSFLKVLFYGNFFYGICAVGLTAVTIEKLALEQVGIFAYLFVFCTTQAFYTWPFVRHLPPPFTPPKRIIDRAPKATKEFVDERQMWYTQHGRLMLWSTLFCVVFALLTALSFFAKHWQQLSKLPHQHFWLSSSMMLLSILYYNSLLPGLKRNLRSYWWAKPMIIGLAWAAISVYLPWIAGQILNPHIQNTSIFPLWLFLDVFIYLLLLALLFDIKDIQADRKFGIKTIASQIGTRNLIFYIIFPVSIFWLSIGFVRIYVMGVPLSHAILYAIPYLALWLIARCLITKKELLYYLAVVDGLILLKAVCGLFAA